MICNEKLQYFDECMSLCGETFMYRATIFWISDFHLVLFSEDPGPLIHLGCGMVSGAVGATSVYPLQVIRTR